MVESSFQTSPLKSKKPLPDVIGKLTSNYVDTALDSSENEEFKERGISTEQYKSKIISLY